MSTQVTVNIFGQEYRISGEESQERILQVASRVDRKMREIDEKAGRSLPLSHLGVLSAVNIANEYQQCSDEYEACRAAREQLEENAADYLRLWDEAKENCTRYMDENENLKKEVNELTVRLQNKERELRSMMDGQGSIREEIKKGVEAQIREAENRYKDLENNFFDLQMENIKMKSELEKLRGELK